MFEKIMKEFLDVPIQSVKGNGRGGIKLKINKQN